MRVPEGAITGRAPSPTFADASLEAAFTRDGYVVVPVLDAEGIERVHAFREQVGPPPEDERSGLFQDTFSNDLAHKRTLWEGLTPLLLPSVRAATGLDHEPVVATFMVKWPTADELDLHRDATLVDEDRFRSVTAWVALRDLGPGDGRLLVVPGSQRHAVAPRPHGAAGSGEGWRDRAVAIDLRAGEAVVFDPALLHGSEANEGPDPRMVAALAVRPAGSGLVYALPGDDGHVDEYELGADALATMAFEPFGQPHGPAPWRRSKPRPRGSSGEPPAPWPIDQVVCITEVGLVSGFRDATPVRADLEAIVARCRTEQVEEPVPEPPGDQAFAVRPRLLAVGDGVWSWDERHRCRRQLSADEVRLLVDVAADSPTGLVGADERTRAAAGRLIAIGLLADAVPPRSGLAAERDEVPPPDRIAEHAAGVVERTDPATDEERRIAAAGARVPLRTRIRNAVAPPKTPVHALFHTGNEDPCLSLGMIVAHARGHQDGILLESYDIHPPMTDAEPALRQLATTGQPAVFLFSDYLWSVERNLALSRLIKQLSPRSVVVHGGPSAPSYPGDAEAFLREHPEVDVLARGEGEMTAFELLMALRGADPMARLHHLESVAGLTLRTADGTGVVRTEDRPRMADLDVLPSPYLTGMFDLLAEDRRFMGTIESNRGCPYGCTFCDWGSATNSRVRQFDLDRVKAEIEWVARNRLPSVYIADANFGMYKRDLEITQAIVEAAERHGYPKVVVMSLAKNTTKYTKDIIRSLVDAGLESELGFALQTSDEQTLSIVRRRNLKREQYDDLTDSLRDLDLPVLTDIMIGLPGSSVESFLADLQMCIESGMTPRFAETHLLPNSPMNDPAYRAEHEIQVDEANRLISTSTYTTDDLHHVDRLRVVFRAMEHFGLLRHVLRFVQWEHDVPASSVIDAIERTVQDHPERYPLLAWVAVTSPNVAVVPVGWEPFYAEVTRFLHDELGVPDTEGLQTVMALQDALMPAPDRAYPHAVELAHDVEAYVAHRRSGGHRPLVDFPPAPLTVGDSRRVADVAFVRYRMEGLGNPLVHHDNPGFWDLVDWELDSPFKRPLPRNAGAR